jgi:beta-galactosidase GanA
MTGPRRLFLGGELHNSSASSPSSLREAFRRVRDVGADTVLAPVSWETVEPREGDFDLSLVDTALEAAETEGLSWVPLWFGAWKNGASTYVPSWVKRDAARFPRARSAERAMHHISPFGGEITEADATVFARVLAHIRDSGRADAVPFVQVENEPGLLGARRDESDAAEKHWTRGCPMG